MTLDQARDEAANILSRVRLGDDPQHNRQTARSEMDVATLCEWYLKDGVALKKESTLASDRARIKARVLPLLGRRPVSSVTTAEVARFLKDVAAGKTATLPKPTTAALKAQGLKGRALAQADRRRRTDPASGMKLPPIVVCRRTQAVRLTCFPRSVLQSLLCRAEDSGEPVPSESAAKRLRLRPPRPEPSSDAAHPRIDVSWPRSPRPPSLLLMAVWISSSRGRDLPAPT